MIVSVKWFLCLFDCSSKWLLLALQTHFWQINHLSIQEYFKIGQLYDAFNILYKNSNFFCRKLFWIPCEYWKWINNFLLKKHMKWSLKSKRIVWLCQSLNIVYFIPKSILTKMDNIFFWISENILFLKVFIHTFMSNIFKNTAGMT